MQVIKCITQEFYIPMQDALWFSILVPLIAYNAKVKSSYKPNGPELRPQLYYLRFLWHQATRRISAPVNQLTTATYLIDFPTQTASINLTKQLSWRRF